MTQRDFFETVVSLAEAPSITPEMLVELSNYAINEINKLDEANAKKREASAKRRAENEPLKNQLIAALGDKTATASELGAAVGTTTSKASAMLRQMVEEGRVVADETKVKGRKVKCYSLPAEE